MSMIDTPQRKLFDDTPWEADASAQVYVASVVFPAPLDGEYDYLVPDSLRDTLEPGRRVRVPLGRGNRLTEGYCVWTGFKPSGGRQLKAVKSMVDLQTLLAPHMLKLTRWIADRYLCTWGQVLETVVPAGVRVQAGTRVTRFVSLAEEYAETWPSLELPPKQANVLRILAELGEPVPMADLARQASCTQAPIQSLIAKGYLVSERHRKQVRRVDAELTEREANLVLNPDQRRALDSISSAIDSGKHETILLHGITGSGKTEVYIQAIQKVVSFGRQAIVMVPEISLTPQTLERFRRRFDEVAVLHSHLSAVERHWHWQQIASGRVPVVVGARSAVFAPTPRPGLIILDEEHETSFKQESAPRYHARDVAKQRAEMEGIPLVLGSATPSLETFHRAQTGAYRLCTLPQRVEDRPLPDVATIDLRLEQRARNARFALSRTLRNHMERVLNNDEQVILLLNRRGYSTHVQCPQCGFVVQCPHCDIAMTYHRTDELILCHYCDHQEPAPKSCSECSSPQIRFSGVGTQRLEAEVRATFPDFPCIRMDTDTMQSPGSHQKAFDAFRKGEARILLGTQMIAKGLDIPNVTLVGVVNADLALHLPDFRAAERTFQLLAQVAGRAGRGSRGGRVLVQTYSPDHQAIQAACRHDYHRFAEQELGTRRELTYPPYGEMIRIIVRGPDETATETFAETLADRLVALANEQGPRIRVLGPAPAPLAKLRDKYRFHIQLQGPSAEALRQLVLDPLANLKSPDEIEWIADVDPISML